MIYKLLFKTVISHTDPEKIHHASIKAVSAFGNCPLLRTVLKNCFAGSVGSSDGPWVGTEEGYKSLRRKIPGRLGLAAGMDKDAVAVKGLSALGFAFIEVGTFTAKGQPGNDKPRLWRIPKLHLIRNRMGFNNEGADIAGKRLRELRSDPVGRSIVIGANIGKTKVTPLEDAVEDYVYSTSRVARWADYLVVNVSSPNTPGLRKLQEVTSLRPILEAVRKEAVRVAGWDIPLLVKIAPDLSDPQIDEVADLVKEMNLSGVVATNTTINHDYGEGGLSGPVLTVRARQVVSRLRERLGKDPLIIGVGGITTVTDAINMLEAGADLLQGLTALIYEGPSWPGKINRILQRAGY